MLKGISPLLSPQLLKILCEMGHGDRLVIADGNFPLGVVKKDTPVIRMDGHGTKGILEAVLQVFPLDTYVEYPVMLMEKVPGDDVETPIWDTYKEIVDKADENSMAKIRHIERYQFYEEASNAYAIVTTGENALYANIMLQKGVVIV